MATDDRAEALRQAGEQLAAATDALELLNKRVVQVETRTDKTRTWMALGLLVMLGLSLALFAANRVTLVQAQDQAEADQRTQVSTCFASLGRLSPEAAAACAKRWGPVYVTAQKQQAKRSADYDRLLREHAALVAEARKRGVSIPTAPVPTTTTTYPDPPQ